MKKLLAVCVLLAVFSIAVVAVLIDLNKPERVKRKRHGQVVTFNNYQKPKNFREYLEHRAEWKRTDPEYAKQMDAEIRKRIEFKHGVSN